MYVTKPNGGRHTIDRSISLVTLVKGLGLAPANNAETERIIGVQGEAGAEFERDARAERETARLDHGDLVDPRLRMPVGQQVDGGAEQPRIGQHRRDVFELDAGFWKIGNVPYRAFDLGH